VYFASPLKGFRWEFGIGARDQKKLESWGLTGREKKFADIFSRLDTIHQRGRQTDRRTDRQTPGDNKTALIASRGKNTAAFRGRRWRWQWRLSSLATSSCASHLAAGNAKNSWYRLLYELIYGWRHRFCVL